MILKTTDAQQRMAFGCGYHRDQFFGKDVSTMKKKLVSFLCVAALVLGLSAVPSSASNELLFLSLNDTLPTLTAQTTPIQYNGWIYVPVNVFNSRLTTVNFGFYYGLTDNDTKLVFYNLSNQVLTFNLIDGTATSSTGSIPYPHQVLLQNGIYYVPAYAICRYFNLTYSYYSTNYGPLLRIKDSNAVLSDALFISSANDVMHSRLNSYRQGTTDSGTGTNGGTIYVPIPSTGSSGSVTTPQTVFGPVQTFPFYFAFQVQAASNLTSVLRVLSDNHITALFFFPADQIAQCADQIRQAAGAGQQIGILPSGSTSQEKLDSAAAARTLLTHVLHQQVRFVLGQDSLLTQEGYLCWSSDLALSFNRSASSLSDAMLQAAAKQSSPCRVLMHGTPSATIFSSTVKHLSDAGNTFLIPKETEY